MSGEEKDTRFIKSIHLRNLLSFGPENEEIELRPLNVLIGPNASGKSNFIEVINILRATPRDISVPIREGGGIKELIWNKEDANAIIEVSILMNILNTTDHIVKYLIEISGYFPNFVVKDEVIKNSDNDEMIYKYDILKNEARLKNRRIIKDGRLETLTEQVLNPGKDFDIYQSIISQRKDPLNYPEITQLGDNLENIRIYRSINTGLKSTVRLPQQTDLPNDFLMENLSNLALIINDLDNKKTTRDIFLDKLKAAYHELDFISTNVKGGTVQIFIHEKGLDNPISSLRMSDGTLRYLCLLAILCHPEPPPLICIEEPEVGLHPDIMPTLAELLIDASKRTQLIVTTHSDVLVSALSETPESVLVCEHDEDGTHMRRLEADKLEEWLKKYTLGELWTMGEIGGTRW